MTHALFIVSAFLIGTGGAAQVAMLASVSRDRGSLEASWISMLGTAVGLTVLLLARALRDDVALTAPLHRLEVWGVLLVVTAGLLVLSMRGIAPGFAVIGLLGLAFIVGAALLIPEIGVAQFVVGLTAGTLLAGLALDHVGAFGSDVRPITLVRTFGVGLALLGALLVRLDG